MSNVIVGYLTTNNRGYSFECADESAGTEANIFSTEEEAKKALAELGWEAEVYSLDKLKDLGVEI